MALLAARMTGGLVSRIHEQSNRLPLTDQEDADLDRCSFEPKACIRMRSEGHFG